MRILATLLLTLPLVACTAATGDDGSAAGSSPSDCTTNIDDGAAAFFQNYFLCVDVSVSDTDHTIASDGLPPHESPYWGEGHDLWVAWDDRGGDYNQNPGAIETANFEFTIEPNPVPQSGLSITDAIIDTTSGTSEYEYNMGAVGIALNGVAMFAAMAAPGDDIYDEAFTFDLYEGHPAGAQYHYHWHSQGPLEVLDEKGLTTSVTPGEAELEVYGIMCDGTVVLGCTELDGTSPVTADFDAQNGHVHDLTDGTTNYFTDRYHTHVCQALGLFELLPEVAYYETTGCPAQGGGPPPGR